MLALTATAGLARRNLLKDILEFTLPAAFLIFFFGLMIYIAMYFAVDNRLIDATLSQADVLRIGQHIGKDYSALDPAQLHRVVSVAAAQTALTTFFVWVGVFLILFLRPPVRWLAGAADYRGVSWIPLATAGALVIGYAVIAVVPGLRIFFDLTPLTPAIHAGILLAALAWGAVQLGAWRGRVLQRFLDLDENGKAGQGAA